MVAKNDITGDSIQTKTSTEKYREGFERIFGKSRLELRLEEELKQKQEKKEEP